MKKLLIDYYRCFEDISELTLPGRLSDQSGFFRFGDAICYGQCFGAVPAKHPSEPLYQTECCTRMNSQITQIPFDVSQVLDNLRFERYTAINAHTDNSFLKNLLRRAYYSVRPALPVSVRKYLQRLHLHGWQRTPFPRWPVDCSVEMIMEQLLSLILQGTDVKRMPFIWFWPEGYSSALIMTHDVETRRGRDFCENLMDIDDRFGIKASFQLVPEARYSVPRALLESIRNRGNETNVHDLNHDGRLFASRDEFIKRVKKINRYLTEYQSSGFRSGSMYRNQAWYDAFEFSYDMSVPNVAHMEPQQGGCCTVMPYFIGKILELPVTAIQDYPLFHILNDYSIGLWQQQVKIITRKHGLISFIIHPDYIIRKQARDIYILLLEYLSRIRSESNIWFALPREVNRWWRERSQMSLQKHGDKYVIEGPGQERARIAYASLTEGRLKYDLEGN